MHTCACSALVLIFALTVAPATRAIDPVLERTAKPAASSTLQAASPVRAPRSVEQQLAALQSEVQALREQVARLESVLKVSPAGATLEAPTISIVSARGTLIRSGNETTIDAGKLVARSRGGARIRADAGATLEASGKLALKGTTIQLNDGSRPIATVGSPVAGGVVVAGSATLLGD